MINFTMWGFDPGRGFGASATDAVGADAAAEQGRGAPEDVTFGAHLAESLLGVLGEDADEESADHPVAFVLTPQLREQIAVAEDKGVAKSAAEGELPPEGDLPSEGETHTTLTAAWFSPSLPGPASSAGGSTTDAKELPVQGSPEVRVDEHPPEGGGHTNADGAWLRSSSGRKTDRTAATVPAPLARAESREEGRSAEAKEPAVRASDQARVDDLTAAVTNHTNFGAREESRAGGTTAAKELPLQGHTEQRAVEVPPVVDKARAGALDHARAGAPDNPPATALDSARAKEVESHTEQRAAPLPPEGRRHTEDRVVEPPSAHGKPRPEENGSRSNPSIAPTDAATRSGVKNVETPTPQSEPRPGREGAPVDRIDTPVQAADGRSTPTTRPQDAPSSDERSQGERQDRRLPEARVQQTTVESSTDPGSPSPLEQQAPRVTAAESTAASVEPGPRLAALSAPVQQAPTAGGDFEVASAPPETRGPLPRETAESIIQSLRMQYQRGGGDAVVHIRPEHLGPVSVSLRVENGSVSAVVNAENPAVAEWLKANEHLLREGLAGSGLHLERFAVRRDGQPPDEGRRAWRPPDERERRRRALRPESTFEITV